MLAASLMELLWKAAAVFLVFGCGGSVPAAAPLPQDLRMSKQEIRDEAKETEGNPQMKMRIRRCSATGAARR